MDLEFIFNGITYKLNPWENTYVLFGGLDNNTATSIIRKLYNKYNFRKAYFPSTEDEIGFYLPLTSPTIAYEVYGEGFLKDFASLYNKIYQNPKYDASEIEDAKIKIDDFLTKIPHLTAYL